MRNKLLVGTLVCLNFFGWGAVVYQNRLQRESEKRVRETVVEELAERRSIEDSVKGDLERWRRDNEFVVQLEYQNKLEERVAGALSGYEQSVSAFQQEMERLVGNRLAAQDEKFLAVEQQLTQRFEEFGISLEKRLAAYEQRQRSDEEELKELRARLAESRAQQRELADALAGLKAATAPAPAPE